MIRRIAAAFVGVSALLFLYAEVEGMDNQVRDQIEVVRTQRADQMLDAGEVRG